jgi:fucose permease
VSDPRARVAVTATFFVHGALFGTWVSRIPAVKRDLALSDGELGIALLGVTVGAVVSLPVAGWLVARRGSRTTIVVGLPLFALLLGPLAFAPSLVWLALLLFAFGAAAGAVDVAMNAHGLAVEARYRRPILSSLHAGWSFGGLVGASAGAAAAWAGFGPEAHFLAVAALLVAGAVVSGRLLLPTSADRPDEPVRLRRPPRQLAALAVLAFCGLFGEGAIADWSAVYVDGPLEGGAAAAALAFASFSVTMAAFRLAGDRLTTRWGAVALAQRGGVAAAAGVALALVGGRPVVALVGFALAGAGLAALVPIAFRAAGSLPGIPAGVGIAALTTVGYSAFLVSPPTIGFAAEAIGLRRALVLVVLLLSAVVVLAPAAQVSRATGPSLEPHPR